MKVFTTPPETSSPFYTLDEIAAMLWTNAKSKAPSRGKKFDLKLNDVRRLMNGGVCPNTGIPFDLRKNNAALPFRASLDRVDNSIGYVRGNIQVTSKIWNTAKWTWEVEDVIRMAKGIMEQYGISETEFCPDTRELDHLDLNYWDDINGV